MNIYEIMICFHDIYVAQLLMLCVDNYGWIGNNKQPLLVAGLFVYLVKKKFLF